MVKKTPDQGDVMWLSSGNPAKGHEQSGRRPVIVLTKKEYNRATGCFLMCPLTTKRKGYRRRFYAILIIKTPLSYPTRSRCVDFTLEKRKYITTVSDEIMSEVKAKIRVDFWLKI